ncbi:hypothetical protein [Mesorhizobium sp. IMUNJ 23232]|uniref:hypothetical protein n=1 Tax=Mesorhizobium sp. IMUNJ 23232 TaxID=3376064 RepID=UPI0037A54E26
MLHQIRDELQVVWLACQCDAAIPQGANQTAIVETINGIGNRLQDVLVLAGEAEKPFGKERAP